VSDVRITCRAWRYRYYCQPHLALGMVGTIVVQ
jgi:plastocyanin